MHPVEFISLDTWLSLPEYSGNPTLQIQAMQMLSNQNNTYRLAIWYTVNDLKHQVELSAVRWDKLLQLATLLEGVGMSNKCPNEVCGTVIM